MLRFKPHLSRTGPTPDPDLVIEVLASIREIPPPVWDAMAGEDVLWHHGWLLTMEEELQPNQRPWYLVVRRGAGLVGAAAGLTAGPTGAMGFDRQAYGPGATIARAVGASLAPLLVCGRRMGLSTPIRGHADLPPAERARIAGLILDATVREAARERRTLILEGVQAGSPLEPLLAPRGFRRRLDWPTTVLDIRWPDFEAYLTQLGEVHAAMPGTIRNERNRARKRGVTIERLRHPGALGPALDHLLQAHHLRLNQTPYPFGEGALARLAERLGDRFLLNVAWRDGQPIGVLHGVITGTTIQMLGIGVDPTHQRDTLAYFVLGYDATVELALRRGVQRIVGGRLVYAVKRRRGFRLQDVHRYVLPRNRWVTAWHGGAALAAALRIRRAVRRTP